jgi:CheY-like chemotaxis protein
MWFFVTQMFLVVERDDVEVFVLILAALLEGPESIVALAVSPPKAVQRNTFTCPGTRPFPLLSH